MDRKKRHKLLYMESRDSSVEFSSVSLSKLPLSSISQRINATNFTYTAPQNSVKHFPRRYFPRNGGCSNRKIYQICLPRIQKLRQIASDEVFSKTLGKSNCLWFPVKLFEQRGLAGSRISRHPAFWFPVHGVASSEEEGPVPKDALASRPSCRGSFSSLLLLPPPPSLQRCPLSSRFSLFPPLHRRRSHRLRRSPCTHQPQLTAPACLPPPSSSGRSSSW